MAGIDKIEKVVEILQYTGKIRRTELVNRLEKEGDMQKQTAYNAIDEAVELGKVFREERFRKMEKIVYFTVHRDIIENEKELFDSMKKRLREFDNRFNYVKDAFPYLSYEEKSIGLESFDLLIMHIWITTETLWVNFGRTNEWKKLIDDVKDRIPPINELMLSGNQEESLALRGHIMNSKIEKIDEEFNNQDFYLHEVRRRHQNNPQENKIE